MDNDLLAMAQLLVKKAFITMKEMELEQAATRRQIKYRIDKLNERLHEEKVPAIRIGADKRILISAKTKHALVGILEKATSDNTYYMNKKERQFYMYIMLFMDLDYITLQHFMDALQVSRSTIILDFKELEATLLQDQIQVRNNRTRGYYLIGEEMDIRRYMMKEVIHHLAEEKNTRVFDYIIEDYHLDIFNYSKLVIDELAQKHKIRFVEDRLVEFIYIFIFLKSRLQHDTKAFTLGNEHVDMHSFKHMKEFTFTNELLQHYKDTEHISEHERHYISSWILGVSFGDINEDSDDCCIVSELIWKIMARFESLSGIHYKHSEDIFIQLYSHIRPAYYRLLFKLPILNPLCTKVKEEYKDLYNLVNETMKPFAPIFGKEIPDDEIAYLTMHFATIYANNKECETLTQKIALVVCSNGIGSSAILYNELKALFPELYFLPPVESNNMPLLDSAVDIIFATTYVMGTFEARVPIIKVSPVMNMRERYQVVRDVYLQLGSRFLKRPDVDMVMDIVKRHASIKDEQGLHTELISYLSKIDSYEEPRGDELHFHELVSLPFIHLRQHAHTWEEAIRMSFQGMIAHRVVSETYVEDIIKTVKRTGPYIVITKHVALPHTVPEAGAKRCAIGITTLQEPVVFGNIDNDPVKYIFALSTVDNEQHLVAMSDLLELLNDQDFYHLMDETQNPQEIMNYISDKIS